jgi:hypothetical protein
MQERLPGELRNFGCRALVPRKHLEHDSDFMHAGFPLCVPAVGVQWDLVIARVQAEDRADGVLEVVSDVFQARRSRPTRVSSDPGMLGAGRGVAPLASKQQEVD